MGLAFIYPGQGNQHPAMFERLISEAAAAPALDALSECLGTNISRLATALTVAQLQENKIAQLLMVGHALAVSALLNAEGISAEVHCGYSVGEISAHACAGAIDIPTALDLAMARAMCMDQAVAQSKAAQGMIALRGLTVANASALAKETGTEIALINGPEHVVLGGPVSGVDAVEAQAAAYGATTVKRLGVHVASHTSFLAPAAHCFQNVLRSTPWRSPVSAVLSGIDGRNLRSNDAFQTMLAAQLKQTVNWAHSVESSIEHGATVFLEIGPGRSLSNMVKELQPQCAVRAFDDFRSAEGVAKWAGRQR